MRVLVLGGGVIGVTSAWYLAAAGCSVTLCERASGPGLETSFANAGQVSPGYAAPWAAPGVPLKALRWLLQRHAPLAIRLGRDPAQYLWLLQMLRNCTAARYARNKARMVRLAEYSRDCLDQLREQTGIAYEGRQLGTLQVFRNQAQLDAAERDVQVLREQGVAFEWLDRAGLERVEPALAGAPLLGGVRLPNDQTGDCHLFTTRLAELAQRAGVEFRYDCQVGPLLQRGGRIEGVLLNGELERAERYVVALGSYSPQLLRPLGLRLPIYPLKGYSLTVPIVDAARAPRSTVLDETYKIALTRFDARIRIGGMAEVCGYDLSLDPRRRATLEMVCAQLFPGAGDLARGEFWTGLRPATPDGTPLVCGTPWPQLFINSGHGTLGWTMACGSARLLSDLILARPPQISSEGLDLSRYGS